jgi:phosphomannomutase
MKAFLDNLIPEFSVRLGGTTSVDVTKQGIDKAYGLDALFPGGNGYPSEEAGLFLSRSEIPMRQNGLSKRSSLV